VLEIIEDKKTDGDHSLNSASTKVNEVEKEKPLKTQSQKTGQKTSKRSYQTLQANLVIPETEEIQQESSLQSSFQETPPKGGIK